MTKIECTNFLPVLRVVVLWNVTASMFVLTCQLILLYMRLTIKFLSGRDHTVSIQ